MSKIERLIIGALGGLSSVLVKFLGQDYDNLVAHAANLTDDQILSYKIGYGILTPILMFLGAFIAWVSDENKRIKLVALAIAAPAMITTWSGGSKAEDNRHAGIDFFLAAAHAGDPSMPPGDTADIGAKKKHRKKCIRTDQTRRRHIFRLW